MTKDVTPARLRLMRERTGMTQGEVANLLHISQQSYSAYETSRVPPATSSAPASRASRCLSGPAITSTRFDLPSPCGNTTVPRTI